MKKGGPSRLVVAAAIALLWGGCSGDGVETDGTGEVSIAQGRRLYRDHGCALCHGEQGRGNGRMAQSLDPPPRDFSKAGEFRLGHDVNEVAEAIRTGAGGRGAMPGYAHLSLTDRQALATFIISLAE